MLSCSNSSRLAGEPLAGTAVARTWRWLGLEVRETWGKHAVEEAELPPVARAWLERFAGVEGTRIQLLRRPHREGPLTCQLADTQAGWVRRFELAGHEDLGGVPLDALLDGRFGEPVDGPVVWVCTHGQRDVCCGTRGGRVFAALRDEPVEVWQTSHLGGHRFAPTLLWLPSGICYGKIEAGEARALVEAHQRGRLHRLDAVRGRVAWSREAQAAEVALRAELNEQRLEAVTLVDERDGRVELAVGGRTHAFQVERAGLSEPVIASCGKASGPVAVLRARRVG